MAKKNKKNKDSKKKKDEEEIEEGPLRDIKIRIIGIGGGGGSVVSEMSSSLKGVMFAVANTDASALESVGKGKKIKSLQFGEDLTNGLGTGMDPELGKKAALEAESDIEDLVEGQDINILVSCLGGGTGSGALPVFAKASKKTEALTYGIFTLPFEFEGQKKMNITKEALKKASPHLNAISVLPNENIFKIVDRKTPLKEALSQMNKNLAASLEGLIETVYEAGLINIDFADIRSILEEREEGRKLAYLNSTVIEEEEEDAKDIVEKATSNPLYPYGIDKAKGVLFNITGGEDIGLAEVSAISQEISSFTEGDARVIFGVSQEEDFDGRMKISLLATGCGVNYLSDEITSSEANGLEEEIEKIDLNNQEEEEEEKDDEEEEEEIEEELEVKSKASPEEIKEGAKELSEEADGKKQPDDKEEEEIVEEEEKWETPAFLRKALKNDDEENQKGDS